MFPELSGIENMPGSMYHYYAPDKGDFFMKKKLLSILCAALLTGILFTGCGSAADQTEDESASDAAVTEEANEDTAADEEETDAPEPETDTEDTEAADTPEAELADGVYTAEFDTDSSMFHVNEANEGLGVLTVENGQMTIHVSLVSKNILNLFAGTAEDAQKDGAVLLEPTTDTVTYSDGLSDEVYGFDIPVPTLDEEFDVAIIGTKGIWYDHKVSVSNPVLQE